MAVSPAHRWGQIIGEVLEAALLPVLTDFARAQDLYLDKKGKRPCRQGVKCAWADKYGNTHDLDFVLERGGSPEKIGTPVAFIEAAWRRYTKHSRNKAQEIQGAILPLAETFESAAPFKGAILAGVFTEGALNQMRSLRFAILYFPYDLIMDVFGQFGIDAASEETTPDSVFKKKVRQYERLPARTRERLSQELMRANAGEVRRFLEGLASSVSRRIESIIVLPLHGASTELPTVSAAITFVEQYNDTDGPKPFQRYEIQIRYNNGDRIEGRFASKANAIDFLRAH